MKYINYTCNQNKPIVLKITAEIFKIADFRKLILTNSNHVC